MATSEGFTMSLPGDLLLGWQVFPITFENLSAVPWKPIEGIPSTSEIENSTGASSQGPWHCILTTIARLSNFSERSMRCDMKCCHIRNHVWYSSLFMCATCKMNINASIRMLKKCIPQDCQLRAVARKGLVWEHPGSMRFLSVRLHVCCWTARNTEAITTTSVTTTKTTIHPNSSGEAPADSSWLYIKTLIVCWMHEADSIHSWKLAPESCWIVPILLRSVPVPLPT